MTHRLRLNASRNIGLSTTVSALALKLAGNCFRGFFPPPWNEPPAHRKPRPPLRKSPQRRETHPRCHRRTGSTLLAAMPLSLVRWPQPLMRDFGSADVQITLAQSARKGERSRNPPEVAARIVKFNSSHGLGSYRT